MADSQTIDVVTYDLKGGGVSCVVCILNDYPMNFILVHDVAMFVMQVF